MSTTADEFEILMQRLRRGYADAAPALLEQYGDHILRAVRRRLNRSMRGKFDSQDFVQAVWASFFQHQEQIAEFENPQALIGFLVRVASNKVVDECRKFLTTEKYNVNRELSLESSTVREILLHNTNQPTPSETAVAKEEWDRLLENQPSHYQRMLRLRGNGATFTEIAQQLGVDEKTVRRVIKKLSERLDS
jgi:RNA polymerase sigma factor (sigma-70 family)